VEKLQEAIAQARASRAALNKIAQEAPQVDDAAAPAPSLEDKWKALRLFEPNEKRLNRNRIVTYGANPLSAPFDVLRTKVILQMRRNNWKRLAITSPSSGCGKTTMACNIAAGLTRQPDIRTILLELDLRRPTISKVMGLKPDTCVHAVLSGKTAFSEQAVRLKSNVAMCIANRTYTDPTRVLLSHDASEILETIENDYAPEIMIFDMPPLLTGDDTRAFLGNVDCVLLVAQAERSTTQDIDVCEREIADQTNMLGVVLNQCKFIEGVDDYGYDAY
jgi:Mrp family chromosome partitioning ATPase